MAKTKSIPAGFEPKLIDQLVGPACEQGLAIDGENGLLAEVTKRLVESVLAGEITDDLGYEKYEHGEGENTRNGTRTKTVQTKKPADHHRRAPATGKAPSN